MAVREAVAKVTVRLTVNGRPETVRAYPMARLLDVLREELHLTGTKEGCGEGECGACAVLLDGVLVNSCLVPIVQAEGAAITTIEGLAEGERLHPVQEAFVARGGVQCGTCAPGMIMAAVSLLDRIPAPTAGEIRRGLAGSLCRCTGYTKIVEAVTEVARAAAAGARGRDAGAAAAPAAERGGGVP